MSSRRGRAYDPWRDVDGTPVVVGARVEQVAVATEHGALPRRLGKRGLVARRAGYRVHVAFDGEDGEPVAIRPFLVRVVAGSEGEDEDGDG